jgi:hypothetical protein
MCGVITELGLVLICKILTVFVKTKNGGSIDEKV